MKWFKRKQEPKCAMEWILLEQCESKPNPPPLEIRPDIAQLLLDRSEHIIQMWIEADYWDKSPNIHVEIGNNYAYVYNLLHNGVHEVIYECELIEDGSLG